MPFFMVYGAEAVMTTDLEHNSPRIVNYAMEENDANRQGSHDLLNEARDLSLSLGNLPASTSPLPQSCR